MNRILSLQKLEVKEDVVLRKKSGASIFCKGSSHASWFAC